MRSLSPRRQSTTLPATCAGSSDCGLHSAASAAWPGSPAAAPSTSGLAGRAPVTDAPVTVKSLAPWIVTVETNERYVVSAATAVVQGTLDGAPTVLAPGPALPAEVATNTPAGAPVGSGGPRAPKNAGGSPAR